LEERNRNLFAYSALRPLIASVRYEQLSQAIATVVIASEAFRRADDLLKPGTRQFVLWSQNRLIEATATKVSAIPSSYCLIADLLV